MKLDLHVHTTFCDGKNSPEEMVLSAIEKGLDTIGLLFHSYTEFDPRYCVKPEKIEEFISEVERLKIKYADKIKVLMGVEQDYFSKPITTFKPDYTLGSVHYVYKNGQYLEIDESEEIFCDIVNTYYNGDYLALCEDYYRLVSDVLEKTNADIIAHFDLITKFNKDEKYFSESSDRYVNAYKKAVDKLIAYNKPFEINTGVIKRVKKENPYPHPDIVEYIKSKGGSFIKGSDSHDSSGIAFQFEKY